MTPGTTAARRLKRAIAGLWQAHRPLLWRGYWRQRARQHGLRAAFNLQHKEEDLEKVTQRQKQTIYPHFRSALRGDERVVLDFGCGPGRFAADLAEMTGGRVIGLDPVAEFLKMAPPNPAVEYRLYDGRKISLPDETVDAAWICLVLGGISGRRLTRTADDLLRVLKAGGLLFLVENTTPNAQSCSRYWALRSVEAYQGLFPEVTLSRLDEYEDMGERITIMSGRKP